jgi:hypothetical protein
MAKTEAKQRGPSKQAATKAFERAWKLLGQLEKRLATARAEESKRRRQLLEATGDEVARRQAQLDEAIASAGRAAALLTELSEMIAANARAQSRQTVSDVAHEAAEAVRAEERAKSVAQAGLPATQRSGPRRRQPAKPPVKPAVRRRASTPAAPAQPAAPKAAPAKAAGPGPSGTTPRRTRASAATKPATRRPVTPARPRPRPRRSLQPGDGGPGESSG